MCIARWIVSICFSAVATFAHAAYPDRPIRLVVPVAPGGAVDVVGRIMAQKLGASLGQNMVVDNRPGANYIIGTEVVSKAPGDGYTLLTTAGGHTINPVVYKKLPYDTFRDFAPVIQTSTNTFGFVVNPSLPARSVKDVAALAKKLPGEMRYGSFGAGNMTHLTAELFAQASGTKLLHVPFKGETPSLVAVLGGEIGVMLTPMQAFAPYVRDGRLRLLATMGEKRTVAFPDVPTMIEAGYREMVISGWSGILAPTGTPADIVNRLQQEVSRILQVPETRDYLIQQGAEPITSNAEQFGAFIKAEAARWSRVIKAVGLAQTQ